MSIIYKDRQIDTCRADFVAEDVSPEGQKVCQEVEKAAQSARAAGEQAWQEAQPHLLSALRQVNAELQKMVSRLEEEK